MKIKCPICNEELVRIDNFYRCLNRHSYDVAKEGYVNLLRKQGGKNYGDSVEMVRARRDFFNKDYYAPLKEKVASYIGKYSPTNLLDLGSGEGYYTNYFNSKLNIDTVGIDISREAVRIASKQNKNVTYIVGSVQEIPMYDKSFDMVTNLFTPIDLNEICRVLKRNGLFISVKVGKNHLLELKQAIYDEVYLNNNEPIVDEKIVLLEKETLNFKINLDNNEDITNLFNMTPYSHHTSLESKQRLKTIKSLNITCSFDIEIYKKKI